MRKLTTFFIVMATLYFTSTSPVAKPDSNQRLLCIGIDATLECLKKNMDPLYLQSYKRHSEILNIAYRKAVACSNPKDTAEYIEIFTMKGLPAETGESLHEEIEELAITSPRCLLDAVLLLNQKAQSEIIASISSPIRDAAPDTKKSLSPFRDDPKYKNLLAPFFGTRAKK